MAQASFEERGARNFPSTAWSCIRVVQDRSHKDYVPAVKRFCSLYWKPVFYFLRTRGVAVQEARDLTEDFLMRFLQPDAVDRADPVKGKFRTFLLVVLKRFVSDRRAPERATKQGAFERQFVSIQALMTDEDLKYEPAAETADDAFNRHWAAMLLETVLEQLRQRFTNENRQKVFEVFMAYRAPTGKRPSQEALAADYQLSRDGVRQSLKEAGNRFKRLLRAEIREQTGSEEDIDEEIRELQRWLEA